MNENLYSSILELKQRFEPEGFIILGLFGSQARGDDMPESDVDILYETTPEFRLRFSGLRYFGRIGEINDELANSLGIKVDIADVNTLNEIGKKYILGGVVYVS